MLLASTSADLLFSNGHICAYPCFNGVFFSPIMPESTNIVFFVLANAEF